MLESTGSHGRGVERRVPEMRRMVEFNCTSTRLVWAERDQTGAIKLSHHVINYIYQNNAETESVLDYPPNALVSTRSFIEVRWHDGAWNKVQSTKIKQSRVTSLHLSDSVGGAAAYKLLSKNATIQNQLAYVITSCVTTATSRHITSTLGSVAQHLSSTLGINWIDHCTFNQFPFHINTLRQVYIHYSVRQSGFNQSLITQQWHWKH